MVYYIIHSSRFRHAHRKEEEKVRGIVWYVDRYYLP
jgi:hypothetical protein